VDSECEKEGLIEVVPEFVISCVLVVDADNDSLVAECEKENVYELEDVPENVSELVIEFKSVSV
jgi:hypothetical protein